MELFLKGFGLFVAFVTLLYTGVSSRRSAEKHHKEMLKLDLEILEKIEQNDGNVHYQRILKSASARANRAYYDFKPYYPVYFRVGLYIYIGFGFIGFSMMYSDNSFWWSVLSYFVAFVGFEMQRRGLTPGMSGEPEDIKLANN